MDFFYVSSSIISRGKGQNIVAKAAYDAREKIKDELEEVTKDYHQKGGIIDKGIITPSGAADWMSDRGKLWNAVQRRELNSKRWKTAQLARSLIIALPSELSDKENTVIIKEFCTWLAGQGMIADYALHRPDKEGDQRNIHAHIKLTLRDIENGQFGNKNRSWNDREFYKSMRLKFAEYLNKHLLENSFKKIDPRSIKEQNESKGLKEGVRGYKKGTIHKGVKIVNRERRINRLIKEYNDKQNIIEEHIKNRSPTKSIPIKPEKKEIQISYEDKQRSMEMMADTEIVNVFLDSLNTRMSKEFKYLQELTEVKLQNEIKYQKGFLDSFNATIRGIQNILKTIKDQTTIEVDKFYKIDRELSNEINKHKSEDQYEKGFSYGIEQSRAYLDAFFISVIKKDDEKMQMKNDKTRSTSYGR